MYTTRLRLPRCPLLAACCPAALLPAALLPWCLLLWCLLPCCLAALLLAALLPAALLPCNLLTTIVCVVAGQHNIVDGVANAPSGYISSQVLPAAPMPPAAAMGIVMQSLQASANQPAVVQPAAVVQAPPSRQVSRGSKRPVITRDLPVPKPRLTRTTKSNLLMTPADLTTFIRTNDEVSLFLYIYDKHTTSPAPGKPAVTDWSAATCEWNVTVTRNWQNHNMSAIYPQLQCHLKAFSRDLAMAYSIRGSEEIATAYRAMLTNLQQGVAPQFVVPACAQPWLQPQALAPMTVGDALMNNTAATGAAQQARRSRAKCPAAAGKKGGPRTPKTCGECRCLLAKPQDWQRKNMGKQFEVPHAIGCSKRPKTAAADAAN